MVCLGLPNKKGCPSRLSRNEYIYPHSTDNFPCLVPASWGSRRALDPPVTCDRLSDTSESAVLWLCEPGACQWARVSARNRYSCILLLAWCCGYVLDHSLLRLWCCLKAVLRCLWSSVVDLDRWGLESKGLCSNGVLWLGFYEASSGCDKAFLGDAGEVVGGWWEAGRLHVLGEGWGHRSEAWGVRCGLRAELSEVEIGAGAVTDIHGLA